MEQIPLPLLATQTAFIEWVQLRVGGKILNAPYTKDCLVSLGRL
jgi:hypothetical protein